MLKTGDKVPDFKLAMATTDGKKEFHLADALGKGDLLFAFFPLAFSVPCTKEVCETRDALHFFQHVGAQAYGFSVDTPHTNIAFAKEQKLDFPLLSDPNFEVVSMIWETGEAGGVKNRAKRGWMIVGANGVVKGLWKSDDPAVWSGLDDVKRILHAGHQH